MHETASGRMLMIGGTPVELRLAALSATTLRVSLLPVAADGTVTAPPSSPELTISEAPAEPLLAARGLPDSLRLHWGDNRISLTPDPLELVVTNRLGRPRQTLRFAAGGIDFALGSAPLFGLGQGGKQFDRRGGQFAQVNGQGESILAIDMSAPGARAPQAPFDLAGEGARITIPWIISAEGFAIYCHRPRGAIDLSGEQGRIEPGPGDAVLPADLFLVVSDDPAEIMRAYAQLTGFSHLPPLWSLGYLQSHRTLDSRDEVLAEARTFRERGLPCDGMIYLGTGFCPDGWNTGHGSFDFNPRIFPDPAVMIDALHAEGFRVLLHVVDPPLHLHGTLADVDTDGATAADQSHVAAYWARHQPALAAGVDGWWPDVGDPLTPEAQLARMRMYHDGALAHRPDQRPFALHRNAWAGIQRYGWLWSGDIDSAWRTLAMQVPAGLNCGLTGIALWGTDTGGFVTTPELTGELYVRWFQFSCFCPQFRGHGRTWKLRLPWGWNTGDYGPPEFDFRRVALPDPRELHNAAVEPICKEYLELRYRLLPYTYSAVREAAETGLPVMRALWLHHPADTVAVGRGDVYLWGRDILVAPVTERGAASRTIYLPAGDWYDFWTGEVFSGGREIIRPVDLATLPLYVRGGAIIPTGPLRQWTGEPSAEPLRITVYPGQDGSATLYEDDGETLDYQRGAWQVYDLAWNDRARRLTLSLQPGSARLREAREFLVQLRDADRATPLRFTGDRVEVTL
jgi:hypothetical protein